MAKSPIMYRLLILLFLAITGSVAAQHRCSHHRAARSIYPAPENLRSDTLDVLNYGIHLDITDFAGRAIAGYTDVELEARQNGVTSVSLDLLHLTIDSITVQQQSLNYSYNDTLIVAQLPQTLNQGDNVTLRVYYHGQPQTDLSGWGGFYFSGSYAFNLGVGFDAAPHNYGRAWFPCFDNFVERSTYDLYIRTSAGRIAASNGERMSVTPLQGDTIETHWRMNETIPTYLACVAVAPYEEVNDLFTSISGSTIPIALFGAAGDTNNLKASFANLVPALNAYEDAFGRYRFNKVGYTLVPFGGGAMEHASMVTYPRNATDGTLSRETLMAHELAHSWWGNLATCETQEDMWLNEGMASFCEVLFLEYVYGWPRAQEDVKNVLLDVVRNAHLDEDGYRAVSGLPHQYTYGTHTYDKGSLVALNLRHYLGDSLFFNGVTDFLDQHAFASMNSAELRDHLEQYSGQNLDGFFDGWVFGGGFPAFEIDSTQLTPAGNQTDVTIYIEQKLRGAPALFRDVPLTVYAYDANWNRSTHRITVDGQLSSASFTVPGTPVYFTLEEEDRHVTGRTADTRVISQTGPADFDHALIDVDVEAVGDSSLVRIEHYWVAPDPVKNFNTQPYRLSDYRYWRVGGIWDPAFRASAQILYDGRSSGGYLDSGLVSITEDSLVLLYRATPADEWEEYVDYTKNILGTSNNGLGLMEISRLRAGEYTLANRDITVLSTPEQGGRSQRIRVYPNPATDRVTFAFETELEEAILSVHDVQGREVFRKKLRNTASYQWNPNRLPNGTYSYQLRSGNRYEQGTLLLSR